MKLSNIKKLLAAITVLLSAVCSFAYDRIVCLSPSGVEILYAVGAGDKLVARTDFCNYPSEAMEKPSVGGFDGKTLSVETIVAYNPDLVYGSKGMHDFLESSLKEFGIDMYLSEAESVDGVLAEITYIGKATGNEKKAKSLVSDMTKKLNKIKKAAGKKKTTAYWETWNAPYMSIGKTSFINELIEIAGGENIFVDQEYAYPMVSEEAIIERNPSVILLPSDSFETAESVSARAGWDGISAVKNGKIVTVDGDICSRPGPRIVEACEILQKIFK